MNSFRSVFIASIAVGLLLPASGASAQPKRFTSDQIQQQRNRLEEIRAERRLDRTELKKDRLDSKAIRTEVSGDKKIVRAAKQEVRKANQALLAAARQGASAEDLAALASQRDAAKIVKANAISERKVDKGQLQAKNQELWGDQREIGRDTQTVQKLHGQYSHRVNNYIDGGRKGFVRDIGKQ